MKKIWFLNFCGIIIIVILIIGTGKWERYESIFETQPTETEIESETETQIKYQHINASVVAKYNGNEIIVYSDTTCLVNLTINVEDRNYICEEKFTEIEVNECESVRLTLQDLAPGFFSDDAVITRISVVDNPYVKGESNLCTDNYKKNEAKVLLKCSSDNITILSDEDCYYDIYLHMQDSNFKSEGYFRKIKLSKGETKTLTLEDLAPGVFSENVKITGYFEPFDAIYVEK